jgi:hypothetical protein
MIEYADLYKVYLNTLHIYRKVEENIFFIEWSLGYWVLNTVVQGTSRLLDPPPLDPQTLLPHQL